MKLRDQSGGLRSSTLMSFSSASIASSVNCKTYKFVLQLRHHTQQSSVLAPSHHGPLTVWLLMVDLRYWICKHTLRSLIVKGWDIDLTFTADALDCWQFFSCHTQLWLWWKNLDLISHCLPFCRLHTRKTNTQKEKQKIWLRENVFLKITCWRVDFSFRNSWTNNRNMCLSTWIDTLF